MLFKNVKQVFNADLLSTFAGLVDEKLLVFI